MKPLTTWRPTDGQGDVNNDNEGSYLKINATDYLLIATGSTDRQLLGATVSVPKSRTVWTEDNN